MIYRFKQQTYVAAHYPIYITFGFQRSDTGLPPALLGIATPCSIPSYKKQEDLLKKI